MKEIKLTQDKVTQVDDDMYDYLAQWKWYAHFSDGRFYVLRNGTLNGKRITIPMHRVIMNTPDGMEVDHIDHDTLNNKKENLRNCSKKENSTNKNHHKNGRAKYLGVCYYNQKYKDKIYPYIIAQIQVDYKKIKIGRFKTEEDAARAYDKVAKRYFGEFANLNFPND